MRLEYLYEDKYTGMQFLGTIRGQILKSVVFTSTYAYYKKTSTRACSLYKQYDGKYTHLYSQGTICEQIHEYVISSNYVRSKTQIIVYERANIQECRLL